MQQPKHRNPAERYAGYDRQQLERELGAAESSNRELRRQVAKLEAQLEQSTRAYNKTVANMVEIVRENLLLGQECERLRDAIERGGWEEGDDPFDLAALSGAELAAIRKAMARLHHPDAGGDDRRMKHWNALIDRIEARRNG